MLNDGHGSATDNERVCSCNNHRCKDSFLPSFALLYDRIIDDVYMIHTKVKCSNSHTLLMWDYFFLFCSLLVQRKYYKIRFPSNNTTEKKSLFFLISLHYLCLLRCAKQMRVRRKENLILFSILCIFNEAIKSYVRFIGKMKRQHCDTMSRIKEKLNKKEIFSKFQIELKKKLEISFNYFWCRFYCFIRLYCVIN